MQQHALLPAALLSALLSAALLPTANADPPRGDYGLPQENDGLPSWDGVDINVELNDIVDEQFDDDDDVEPPPPPPPTTITNAKRKSRSDPEEVNSLSFYSREQNKKSCEFWARFNECVANKEAMERECKHECNLIKTGMLKRHPKSTLVAMLYTKDGSAFLADGVNNYVEDVTYGLCYIQDISMLTPERRAFRRAGGNLPVLIPRNKGWTIDGIVGAICEKEGHYEKEGQYQAAERVPSAGPTVTGGILGGPAPKPAKDAEPSMTIEEFAEKHKLTADSAAMLKQQIAGLQKGGAQKNFQNLPVYKRTTDPPESTGYGTLVMGVVIGVLTSMLMVLGLLWYLGLLANKNVPAGGGGGSRGRSRDASRHRPKKS